MRQDCGAAGSHGQPYRPRHAPAHPTPPHPACQCVAASDKKANDDLVDYSRGQAVQLRSGTTIGDFERLTVRAGKSQRWRQRHESDNPYGLRLTGPALAAPFWPLRSIFL